MTKLAKNSVGDYVAMTLKSALGIIPLAGPFLSEIAGSIIPNQKVDRIVQFAEILDVRLTALEDKKVLDKVKKDEHFTDLTEEGMRQASSSLSVERREYLASIIANSISSDDIEYADSKHLMRILGELNDVEVIWLRYYADPRMSGDLQFREQNKEVLVHEIATLNADDKKLGKAALQDSYLEHLSALGLLQKEFEIKNNGIHSELETKNYRITTLGRLLLREIGLISSLFEI